MNFRLRFHARRESFFGDSIGLFIASMRAGGIHAVAQPVAFKTRDPLETCIESEPALRMDREAAQTLMDELWHVGIRPTEGSGSAGSLAATERHLEDMRALVFKTQPKDRK